MNNNKTKFEPAKKQLVDLPNIDMKNIDKINVGEEFTDTKFVTVDKMRLNNINMMIEKLKNEFDQLNKCQDDGRDKYSVNANYYKNKNDETLKKIEKLND